MPHPLYSAAPAVLLATLCSFATFAGDYGDDSARQWFRSSAQVGDRPFYLVEGMDDSRLKRKLQSCENGPFYKSAFHRSSRRAAAVSRAHQGIV
jgi:glycerophosphoryl diester phosphodiesterase